MNCLEEEYELIEMYKYFINYSWVNGTNSCQVNHIRVYNIPLITKYVFTEARFFLQGVLSPCHI